jgi:hypothetical protein
MTFRYGIVTVRVRQPLGGFTGTARVRAPGRALRLCRLRSTPHARRYQPDLSISSDVVMPNIGDRVALVDCPDPYTANEPGTRGTVRLVASLGTVHVVWNDG